MVYDNGALPQFVGSGDVEVPVVPCDDAAVKRAARAIFDVESTADATAYNTGAWLIEAARAALRAAGEEPA